MDPFRLDTPNDKNPCLSYIGSFPGLSKLFAVAFKVNLIEVLCFNY